MANYTFTKDSIKLSPNAIWNKVNQSLIEAVSLIAYWKFLIQLWTLQPIRFPTLVKIEVMEILS